MMSIMLTTLLRLNPQIARMHQIILNPLDTQRI